MRWRNPEELTDMRARVQPPDDDSVSFGDDVLDREPRIEAHDEHLESVPDPGQTLPLPRQRIVFQVVDPNELLEEVQVALVEDFLVDAAGKFLVGPHAMLPPVEFSRIFVPLGAKHHEKLVTELVDTIFRT
jgi:hypothetical protein